MLSPPPLSLHREFTFKTRSESTYDRIWRASCRSPDNPLLKACGGVLGDEELDLFNLEMSFPSRSSRSLRKKLDDDDADKQDEKELASTKKATTHHNVEKKKKKKSKGTKSVGASVLSFDDGEGDGEAFQVKKTKKSIELSKKRKKITKHDEEVVEEEGGNRRSGAVPASDRFRSGGGYSKEMLESLRKNTMSNAITPQQDLLKKELERRDEARRDHGEGEGEGGLEKDEVVHTISHVLDEDDEEGEGDMAVEYPDNAIIERAKKKRETMRYIQGSTGDFIPLHQQQQQQQQQTNGEGGGRRITSGSITAIATKKSSVQGRGGRGVGMVNMMYGYTDENEGSTLVRDQDDDEEEEVFEGESTSGSRFKMQFGDPGKEKSTRASTRGGRGGRGGSGGALAGIVDLDGDDDDVEEEDEEIKRWEMEQMKKGNVRSSRATGMDGVGGRGHRNNAGALGYGSNADPMVGWLNQQGLSGRGEGGVAGVRGGRSYDGVDPLAHIPPGPTVTADSVQHNIEKSLKLLRERQENKRQRAEQLKGRIEDIRSDQATLRGEIQKLNTTYVFYQDIMVYVNNLLSCVSGKVGIVEDLEHEMEMMYLERFAGPREVQAEKMREETLELKDLLNGAEKGRGGKQERDEKPQVDEFGRDTGKLLQLARQRRRKERQAERERKRKMRERMRVDEGVYPEGMSSEEEDERDLERATQRRQEILEKASEVGSISL